MADLHCNLQRVTETIECPKSMIGRVIGKNGATIKALQAYTGASIHINQTMEPTQVMISGMPSNLSLAVSIVNDIMNGTFKGFALLRQVTSRSSDLSAAAGTVRLPPHASASGVGKEGPAAARLRARSLRPDATRSGKCLTPKRVTPETVRAVTCFFASVFFLRPAPAPRSPRVYHMSVCA